MIEERSMLIRIAKTNMMMAIALRRGSVVSSAVYYNKSVEARRKASSIEIAKEIFEEEIPNELTIIVPMAA